MTTATAPLRTASAGTGSVGLPQVVRSEWTKLWSVRSTAWSLLAMVVVTIGFSALFAWGFGESLSELSPAERSTVDPTTQSVSGLAMGQLAIAVLGVLVITSEYSTGGIRTSLVAVPNRVRMLLAKAVVLTGVALVVGLVTSFGAFFAGQAVLRHYDLSASLSDIHVLRAVAGGGLYLLMSALFGYALGTVLRQTAGAIVAVVAGLLVVPPLLNLLPGDWGHTVMKYFTSNAGQQITNATSLDRSALGPWAGYAAFAVETLGVLGLGLFLVTRRDA
jgi:ABC-2 type transport system permease protein